MYTLHYSANAKNAQAPAQEQLTVCAMEVDTQILVPLVGGGGLNSHSWEKKRCSSGLWESTGAMAAARAWDQR